MLLTTNIDVLAAVGVIISQFFCVPAVARTPCVAFAFAAQALLCASVPGVVCSPAVAGVLFVETDPAVVTGLS
jgi:hypothetical protein